MSMIENVVDDVNTEVEEAVAQANEPVASYSIKRWHVGLAAVVITFIALIVIL